MKRSLATFVPGVVSTLVCTIASIALLAGSTSSAAAVQAPRPSPDDKLLSIAQVTRVYPAFVGGTDHFSTKYGLTAPALRPQCLGRRTFTAPVQASSYYIDKDARGKAPDVGQNVLVYGSVERAKKVLNQYRRYLRTCEGRRWTSYSPHGPNDVLAVEKHWRLPKVGDDRVGLLRLLSDGQFPEWTGIVATRLGTSVSVLEVSPVDGSHPSKKRAVRASRIALRNLR